MTDVPKVRVRERKAAPAAEPQPQTRWPNGSAVFRRAPGEAQARKAFAPDEDQPGFVGRIVQKDGGYQATAWRGADGYEELGNFTSMSDALLKLAEPPRKPRAS